MGHEWSLSWFWTTTERPEVRGFSYVMTFLADPLLWNTSGIPQATDWASYFRPTFTHEVLYPAEKAMLYGGSAIRQRPTVGFADGSVAVIEWSAVLTQISGPFSSGQSPYDSPGYGTPDGVRGRDVAR